MTDEGKQALFEERRIQKSKDVKIQFVDGEFQSFNVLDEEGNMKYCGKVIGKDQDMDDYCICQSFYHSNTKTYQDEHGFSFNCKHIISARELRFRGYPK